jgi:hypothetical protein
VHSLNLGGGESMCLTCSPDGMPSHEKMYSLSGEVRRWLHAFDLPLSAMCLICHCRRCAFYQRDLRADRSR